MVSSPTQVIFIRTNYIAPFFKILLLKILSLQGYFLLARLTCHKWIWATLTIPSSLMTLKRREASLLSRFSFSFEMLSIRSSLTSTGTPVKNLRYFFLISQLRDLTCTTDVAVSLNSETTRLIPAEKFVTGIGAPKPSPPRLCS